MSEPPTPRPFNYHLELTPAQLKVLQMALREMRAGELEDPERDQRVLETIETLLSKLPKDAAIDSIPLGDDPPRGTTEQPARPDDDPDDDGPGPSAA